MSGEKLTKLKRLSNNISNEIQLLNIYQHFYWPQYYFGFIQRLRIWMNCTKSREKCVTYFQAPTAATPAGMSEEHALPPNAPPRK